MNYFAHGMRFVDRPWFLAGTALPDWLSVIDRRVRMRAKRVALFANDSSSVEAEVASGVLQHLNDDHWFHRTRTFAEATGHFTHLLREFLGPGDGFRCGFLGHIATELILDSLLIQQYPFLLDRYYQAMEQLDARKLAAVTSLLADSPVDLAPWLPRFCQEQFLRDYAEPSRLLYRLNQVLRRIKLEPLPDGAQEVLVMGRKLVEAHASNLLPRSHFAVPQELISSPSERWP